MRSNVSSRKLGALLAVGIGASLATPSACTPPSRTSHPALPAAHAAFGSVSQGRITVHEATDRPRLTTVARSGDPAAAIAIVVLTGGDSTQSVSLAAVMRERLKRHGFEVDVTPDRLSYRIHGLVHDERSAAAFLHAARTALEAPVRGDEGEIQAVARALQALRAHPLDGPELEPVASCTGELGQPATASMIDPASPRGLATLEQWRRSYHGTQRIAVASVGPEPIGHAVEHSIRSGAAWPNVTLPEDPWPNADTTDTYALPSTRSSSPTLTIAARVSPAFATAALAEGAFGSNGALSQRLAATTSWRLRRTIATVRPRGGCLSLTLDRDPARKDSDLANDAARVTAMAVHEIRNEISSTANDASVAGDRVLRAADPREAAALAAWWSFAARLEGGDIRVATALGTPVTEEDPKASPDALDRKLIQLRTSLQSAIPRFAATWNHPVIDASTRVEQGQGRLWLMFGTPCGTTAESENDAGYSALAVVAAARTYDGTEGVRIEPWVAQDGVGVIAQATPRDKESPSELATRVANVAASAMLGPAPTADVVRNSRAQLLGLIEMPSGSHSEPHGMLARTMAPDHPAWLAPFGLHTAIVEGDIRSIELRRKSIASSPLRVAVIANHDEQQAAIAVRTVDRWLVHRGAKDRVCPPSASAARGEQTREVVIRSNDRPPHAMLGIGIRSPTPADRYQLELLREALDGPDGWMQSAFRSFSGPVRVVVRTVGGAQLGALIIEVHCADGLLDRAVQQARGVLSRVRLGAATEQHLESAAKRVSARQVLEQLDPRTRLQTVWRRGPSPVSAPNLATWKSWLTRTLPDDAVVIVRVRPPDVAEG